MHKVLIIIFLLLAINIFPCSIFKYSDNGNTYFCGNEDWGAKDPAVMTIQQTEDKYGVVLLGWERYLPDYPQAGINSEGLCFDWAMVPSQEYKFISGKENLNISSTIEILQTCKDINDVLEYLESYNFSHIAQEHIMFTDRDGKSCVIEYTNGEMRILVNESIAQYITNFNLTDKEAGWYPCNRYSALDSKLNERGLDEEALADVLDNVHQEGANPTIYSYIFNLREMKIRLFYNHNYDKYQEYGVNELVRLDVIINIE